MLSVILEILALLYALIDLDPIFIISAALVLLSHAYLMSRKMLHPIFLILFPGLLFIYFLGSQFQLFSTIFEYDSVLHFAAGFVASLLFASLIYHKKSKKQNPLLLIIIVGFLVGAAWEFYEWQAGQFLPQYLVGDIDDLAQDLVTNTLGATLAAFLAPYCFKRR